MAHNANDVNMTDPQFEMKSSTESMLFAEELVNYFIEDQDFLWECNTGVRHLLRNENFAVKRFTEKIRESVKPLFLYYIQKMTAVFNGQKMASAVEVRHILYNAGKTYLSLNYYPERFLTMAVCFAGIAALHYRDQNREVAGATAQIISHLLNSLIYRRQFDVKTDWSKLESIAQDIMHKRDKLEELDCPPPFSEELTTG